MSAENIDARGTAERAQPLWGNATYQKRAQAAFPHLVSLARAGETITYTALASQLGIPSARTLNFVLGSIGATLQVLSLALGEHIPPLDALVVNAQTGVPGAGIDHFLSTLTGAVPATREDQIRLAQQAVFYYPNWDKVQYAIEQGPPDEGVTLSGRPDTPRQRQFWWVNHKQTHRQELEGEYLWSPKVNQNGARNESYRNMTRVYPGDVVFSFADTAIRAIGIVMGRARESLKPLEFGKAGSRWTKDLGWQVPVRFMRLQQPLRPKLHMQVLGPLLPGKYSPIRASGDGNEGTYLAHVPRGLADKICELLNGRAEEIISQLDNFAGMSLADAAEQVRLEQRLDIGPTEKLRLAKARTGQGVYRTNLELFEKSCRVTGVTDPDHLRASHIKPWCKCNDLEKLDGHNGLLLAPHVDHLFDRGHLSFSDMGEIMISRFLDPTLLARWGIPIRNVGAFRPEQRVYLDYHRQHIFERQGKSRG